MKNILEQFEHTAFVFPEKAAVISENHMTSFRDFFLKSKRVGSGMLDCIGSREPAAVLMDKSTLMLEMMFGTVYAGGFYVPVDPEFPARRIAGILEVLQPALVITVPEYADRLAEAGWKGRVRYAAELEQAELREERLAEIRQAALDTDPLYGIFTSGSTGTPKCVVVSHRAAIDFITTFTDTFRIDETEVLANQAPFDFDVSVKDIYSCMRTGATLVLIPRRSFSLPGELMELLQKNHVTTLIWAVSALCILWRLHALKYLRLPELRKVMFSGEMMPAKAFDAWRTAYPEAMFVNLYGPTEITCNCTYYVIGRGYSTEKPLPAGRAFDNERVFLLDETDQEITEDDKTGELCVAGTTLALGYYHNPEATAAAFTMNPLQKAWPEMIYRTGDLAFQRDGLLYFAGRRDFQIKHMGHRIELEEIERAMNSLPGIERSCCLYDQKKNRIIAAIFGTFDTAEVEKQLQGILPEYMIPTRFTGLTDMPLTKNGKLDRRAIADQVLGEHSL